jgi:hypothetical protein
VRPRIAVVEGDDLLPRLAELRAAGERFLHLDKGMPLDGIEPLTANAYLGGWGIAEALRRGADIVITGRVTDAALTLGPLILGWRRRPNSGVARRRARDRAARLRRNCLVIGATFDLANVDPIVEHYGRDVRDHQTSGTGG